MISLFKVNQRVGDSFRPVKGSKRANRRILRLKKVEKFIFCSCGWGGGTGVLSEVLYGEALQKIIKATTFPRFFHKHRMHLLALFSLFTHGYDRFPYPFNN